MDHAIVAGCCNESNTGRNNNTNASEIATETKDAIQKTLYNQLIHTMHTHRCRLSINQSLAGQSRIESSHLFFVARLLVIGKSVYSLAVK
mmetsp:Transcript_10006/g.21533  ORF Transcript_10006/g.21533 Transcript_10006/m.21533 type:complete len:90 (-) Transcript_10006:501-770(-)